MDWTHEMSKMLSVFEHQAMQSLGVIKLAFRSNGMPFESSFKEYFLRASTNRLSETFNRFEIKSQLEDEMLCKFSDEMEKVHPFNETMLSGRSQQNVAELVEMETDRRLVLGDVPSHFDNQNVSTEQGSNETTYESSPSIQIDDSDDNDFVTVKLETEPTVDLYGMNEPAVQQSNINGDHNINVEDSTVSNFAVEMDESNDSIEMVENQIDPTAAEDDELNPELTQGMIKAKRLNHENSHEEHMMKMAGTHKDQDSLTSKGAKCPPKKLSPTNAKRCTVCGYTTFQMGHFNRHMRIHTGEKRYPCDRCGRAFTNTANLLKHVATHVGEFPFHCRACFHGFSLKVEVTDHEKRCQKRHYECHLCKFVTCIKTGLTRHMRKHTGDKPFHCEICMKHFAYKQDLKQHSNTIHT